MVPRSATSCAPSHLHEGLQEAPGLGPQVAAQRFQEGQFQLRRLVGWCGWGFQHGWQDGGPEGQTRSSPDGCAAQYLRRCIGRILPMHTNAEGALLAAAASSGWRRAARAVPPVPAHTPTHRQVHHSLVAAQVRQRAQVEVAAGRASKWQRSGCRQRPRMRLRPTASAAVQCCACSTPCLCPTSNLPQSAAFVVGPHPTPTPPLAR